MEPGGGFFTLINFLLELEQYAESVLTRKRYVALYNDGPAKEHGLPDKHFDAKPGATFKNPPKRSDDDYISADSVRHRRIALEKANEKVVQYANKFIAHRTQAKKFDLKFEEMYAAGECIFEVYASYYNVITGGTWMTAYPVSQFNWFKPFEFPWLTKDFKEWKPPK
jgi:hypothetical protein